MTAAPPRRIALLLLGTVAGFLLFFVFGRLVPYSDPMPGLDGIGCTFEVGNSTHLTRENMIAALGEAGAANIEPREWYVGLIPHRACRFTFRGIEASVDLFSRGSLPSVQYLTVQLETYDWQVAREWFAVFSDVLQDIAVEIRSGGSESRIGVK